MNVHLVGGPCDGHMLDVPHIETKVLLGTVPNHTISDGERLAVYWRTSDHKAVYRHCFTSLHKSGQTPPRL